MTSRSCKTYTFFNLQWTEAGAVGNPGGLVQSLVAADHKTALAYAITLHRPMAERNASESANGHVCVTQSLARVSQIPQVVGLCQRAIYKSLALWVVSK